jgi:hypothetical protein
MYAAARTIPLALFALAAIYKRATPALLILGSLAGAMQLLDAGIGLFEHDLGKCAGPFFIAVLQLFVVYQLADQCGSPFPPRNLIDDDQRIKDDSTLYPTAEARGRGLHHYLLCLCFDRS